MSSLPSLPNDPNLNVKALESKTPNAQPQRGPQRTIAGMVGLYYLRPSGAITVRAIDLRNT